MMWMLITARYRRKVSCRSGLKAPPGASVSFTSPIPTATSSALRSRCLQKPHTKREVGGKFGATSRYNLRRRCLHENEKRCCGSGIVARRSFAPAANGGEGGYRYSRSHGHVLRLLRIGSAVCTGSRKRS